MVRNRCYDRIKIEGRQGVWPAPQSTVLVIAHQLIAHILDLMKTLFTLSLSVSSVCPPSSFSTAHSSPLSPFTVFEMNAPTISEISAISIR